MWWKQTAVHGLGLKDFLNPENDFVLWITTVIVTVLPLRALTPSAKGEADSNKLKLQAETSH